MHSRIYHFAGGYEDPLDGELFIGSADWMSRNLLHRVEAIVPIVSRVLRSDAGDPDRLPQRSAERLGHAAGRQLRPAAAAARVGELGAQPILMALTRRRAGGAV